jgi:hypothetical protein
MIPEQYGVAAHHFVRFRLEQQMPCLLESGIEKSLLIPGSAQIYSYGKNLSLMARMIPATPHYVTCRKMVCGNTWGFSLHDCINFHIETGVI